MTFWAYILHCNAGRFYTGHTDDLERRIAQHKRGEIPGFTRDFLPVELAWSQEFATRQEAKAAEKQIKGWSRKKKLALIRGDWEAVSRHAKSKGSPSTGSGQTGKELSAVVVASEVIVFLQAEAANACPRECCGILLGTGSSITAAQAAANVHAAPETHFTIDPQALIDAHRNARRGGPQVLGYYHSHPLGPANPSATDRAEAAHDGAIWALIAPGDAQDNNAGSDVSFWRDDESGFTLLPYTADDG